MSIATPLPNGETLAKRERIIAATRAIVPGKGVIVNPLRRPPKPRLNGMALRYRLGDTE